eukprot:Blabericola_migrator_1__551@NODE_1136_length_5316_cov_209_214517_g772_i0_p5_GENE_NODE_1136_length_5316_cov_209_214517_g772_i0NODE_1136_length_5316_cov_209_214517_g772_i0_p5_ORF_typecomplete_len126_score3_80CTP_transf_1/PF01148_20/1_9e14CarSlike/PF01864_17/0_004_NODE_1136_length_5316_cov_209_214517_g772_i049195296
MQHEGRDLGHSALIFALLCPWVADTGALIGGSMAGSRRPLKSLSPNKTIEGFLSMLPFTLMIVHILRLLGQYVFVEANGLMFIVETPLTTLWFWVIMVSLVSSASTSCVPRRLSVERWEIWLNPV